MKYFVSPAEKPKIWSMAPDTLALELGRRWPHAEVRRASPQLGSHSLEWTVEMPHGSFDGALDQDGQALILDGAIEDCGEVALWFRSLVPEEQTLLFYDEAFNSDVAIRRSTKLSEIVTKF